MKFALAAALAATMAACGGDPAAPEQAASTGDDAASESPAPAAAPPQDSGDAHQEMSVDELRAAAGKAYAESRLYAPPGDNALEYYLALRERLPGDAAVSSALTDLLPMTVIATEQSRDREDYEEARRLRALIERASPGHPALARLGVSIDEAEERSQQQIAQRQLTAEQEAERQSQLQAERQRQQQEQQEEAARLAQEQAEREEAQELEAAQREEREREAARVAEQQAAQQREAQAQAAARPATPAVSDVRPISTPAPRYPPEALRAGQSGEVMVEFTVNQDGTVANARVVRADPARVFDREAVAAVRRWRFEPVAEPVTTRRTIGFNPGN
ncbi:energy transducer TonB [Luteimonas sp. A277]